jgi:hypothetical protein
MNTCLIIRISFKKKQTFPFSSSKIIAKQYQDLNRKEATSLNSGLKLCVGNIMYYIAHYRVQSLVFTKMVSTPVEVLVDFWTRDHGTHSKVLVFGISYGTLHIEFYNEQQTETQTSNMTTSNVSTAVKIVVSMAVVAALVATQFSSSEVRQ